MTNNTQCLLNKSWKRAPNVEPRVIWRKRSVSVNEANRRDVHYPAAILQLSTANNDDVPWWWSFCSLLVTVANRFHEVTCARESNNVVAGTQQPETSVLPRFCGNIRENSVELTHDHRYRFFDALLKVIFNHFHCLTYLLRGEGRVNKILTVNYSGSSQFRIKNLFKIHPR